MEVQQLVEPFATSVHHASRLKFFSDAALDVTDALVDYAAFGDEGFLSRGSFERAFRAHPKIKHGLKVTLFKKKSIDEKKSKARQRKQQRKATREALQAMVGKAVRLNSEHQLQLPSPASVGLTKKRIQT
ncbi:hypothetical protein DYB31_014289 [Aphanomyces astaci]|uniref:Uncharacterized protein n=1 Tax=Aphanomyces astaci TaxID=112090 RepID=A0A397ENV0_APHAT|nr:hypothetical protein DYB31_014289 [Aphanomyces astaci]